jgi:hypothetical protein
MSVNCAVKNPCITCWVAGLGVRNIYFSNGDSRQTIEYGDVTSSRPLAEADARKASTNIAKGWHRDSPLLAHVDCVPEFRKLDEGIGS